MNITASSRCWAAQLAAAGRDRTVERPCISKRRMVLAHSTEDGSMTPEEEQYYEQYMQEQKQKRMQQLTAYKRRIKFNPLDTSAKVSEQEKPVSSPSQRSQPTNKAAPRQPSAATSSAATLGQIASADIAAMSDSDDLQTLLKELDLDDLPEVQIVDDDDDDDVSMPARSTGRPLSLAARAAQQRKLAAKRRSTSLQQQQQESQQQLQQVQALMKQMQAQDAAPGAEEQNENADIDWDALATYEKFENYATEQAKLSSNTKRPAPPSTKPAGPKQSQSSSAAAKSTRSPAVPAEPSSPADADEQLQLDKDLDDLEQLIKLFELTDKQSSQQQLKKPSAPAGQQQGEKPEDDDINWDTVEKLLLGDQWEQELAAAGDDDIIDVTPVGAQQQDGAADGGDDDDAEPWADEVTNLLLGLVGISHKKYLARPLLEPEPAEEQRAATVWTAPFVLMVHDDSEQCLLEYGNKAAMALFEMEYLDFFGTSSFALVDPDADVQQDWIWAMRDVEERFDKFTVVPRLRMMTSTGRAFVAKDVLVFRVDSLEDEPIGQAVMFSKWQFKQDDV